MKIYFGTSPRIKDKYPELIGDIYGLISKLGGRHTSDWVKNVSPVEFYKLGVKELDGHQKKISKAINLADICIFEVSLHSLSIGYLVNYALEHGKSVIVMGQDLKPLTIFRSLSSDKLISFVYNKGNLEEKLKKALSEAVGKNDVRFNFFVSPKILNYLDWVAKTKRIPRSVFLRGLIEKEMRKDGDFKA